MSSCWGPDLSAGGADFPLLRDGSWGVSGGAADLARFVLRVDVASGSDRR